MTAELYRVRVVVERQDGVCGSCGGRTVVDGSGGTEVRCLPCRGTGWSSIAFSKEIELDGLLVEASRKDLIEPAIQLAAVHVVADFRAMQDRREKK